MNNNESFGQRLEWARKTRPEFFWSILLILPGLIFITWVFNDAAPLQQDLVNFKNAELKKAAVVKVSRESYPGMRGSHIAFRVSQYWRPFPASFDIPDTLGSSFISVNDTISKAAGSSKFEYIDETGTYSFEMRDPKSADNRWFKTFFFGGFFLFAALMRFLVLLYLKR